MPIYEKTVSHPASPIGMIILIFGSLFLFKIPIVNGMLEESNAAVRNGRVIRPFAREIDAQIPDAVHSISYFTEDYGIPTWNTTFGLYGRYVVTIKSQIEFDRTRKRIQSYSPPKGYVKEVDSIDVKKRYIRMNSSSQRNLDSEQIEAFLSSGCDLRLLDIQLITDDPLEEFEIAL